jgi:peptidoglycan hydrolase CwlO-like protein
MIVASEIIRSGIFILAVVGNEEIEIGNAMRAQKLELLETKDGTGKKADIEKLQDDIGELQDCTEGLYARIDDLERDLRQARHQCASSLDTYPHVQLMTA